MSTLPSSISSKVHGNIDVLIILNISQAPTIEQTDEETQQYYVSDHDEAGWKEIEHIAKVADASMAELLKLIRVNGPLWTKSSHGEGYVLVSEKYANMFPRVDSLNRPHTREESSKHYTTVRIRARQLVEMLLDSEEWVNIFPTIVSQAEKVVLDLGSLDDRNGALQVVYEKMHGISPLVSSRELVFLRCCQKIGEDAWAIAHVSIDSFRGCSYDFPARRLPSGCMIYQMTKEFCMVTWIEHVEVNDRITQRGHIRNNIAYGAERWLWALHRMCERFACTSMESIPLQATQEVVNTFNAIKKSTKFSDRMVQGFCRVLHESRHEGFIQENSNAIKITLRTNTAPDMPEGIIATAVTSIRLPVPPHQIVSLLTEARKRSKWDVLSCGLPVNELRHFTIGGSRISILKIYNRIENDVMIFQDSYTNPLGSYVVYAPISMKNACLIMNGDDPMVPKVLPSGFLISKDNRTIVESSSRQHPNNRSGGSFLTVVYQLLLCSNEELIGDIKRETVAGIVISILQKIKNSFNNSN
uniref:Homeobox-leucine zipper protein HDG8 n=1 Tax=Cajanus cajan TaxID=3821 RepID=A0A151SZI0_CAJCA|nr:Homeobox-leucine zipper protein HDG8 [Cajanus cajan]